MEKALAIQKEVQRILGTEKVYLVGGSVRDIVMGNEPKDYDFTTPLLPEVIEERVIAAGRHVYGIGKKFGTIGFKILAEKLGMPFQYEYVEVTTFRSEVYTSKSRKPEVQFVPSLDEDLARRDFTMNAMVLKSDGKIYDPYGGRIHIHSKEIKTVGMPKDRIQEDPLRMLRAARFAARYNFKIDPNFIGKARQLADRIYDVSVERWVQELDKLITSEHAITGIVELNNMGLLQRILPEFDNHPMAKNPEKINTVISDPNEAWKILLKEVHENPKVARYIAQGICARLKFSNDRTKIVLDN